MSASKRRFLQVLGGAAIVAAAAGTGWAFTRDPVNAREPWSTAGAVESDPRRWALSYAILAPNPHNRQPWLVRLIGDDEIVLTCDRERLLPVTDPENRQITIGLGGFLELLAIAAAETGHRAEITAFPDGEPMPTLDDRPVAHIRFVADPAVARDPLFRQIVERRSNKEPYDTDRAVPPDALASLRAAGRHGMRIEATADPDRVAALRELADSGMRTELTTPQALDESVKLTRIGRAEIEANPDGVDLGGAFFEALETFGFLDRADMADTSSSTFKQMYDAILTPMATSMAFVWLISSGNSRVEQIAAGRDYVRVNLQATALGLGIHPLSQALQEFAAMRDLLRQAHDMTGAVGNERLQMFCRLGYGPSVPASPRWPLTTRIIDA